MKRIDFSKLRKGDILLTTSLKPMSKVIQVATRSDISHAMLYVANGSVMDSTNEGVHARNLQREIYDDGCAIYAYRAKVLIDSGVMDRIVSYARSEAGSPYSMIEAMRSPLPSKKEGGSAQFCSRLVARAYASAGIRLTNNPDFATPADLQRSPMLEVIPDVVIDVTAQEKEELEGQDSVKGMRAVTNDLLDRVREISPSIRVMNDIHQFLLANPSFDASIAEAYRLSGFLDYWRVELERHPYRYDSLALVQFYHATSQKAELIEYCRETLKDDAANDFAHWRVNLEAYGLLYNMMPLETFELNQKLYLTLCFNHERRVNAAKVLLKGYGDE